MGGKILLGLRSPDRRYYPGVWDIFGGHCEDGESVECALKREIWEELGVRPLKYVEIGMFEEPNPAQYGEGEHHVFVISKWEGKPNNRGEEHAEIRWFSRCEFLDIKMATERYIDLFQNYL